MSALSTAPSASLAGASSACSSTRASLSGPSRRHATLFVLLDGIADVTLKQLADEAHPFGRTPMQAAHMPHMDQLARQSPAGRAAARGTAELQPSD
jgi:hypothetical protein